MDFHYNIGYLDGRNHALSLTAKWIEHSLQKHMATEKIFAILGDRTLLEDALFEFDPGFFNNYDAKLGPIE